MSIPANYINFSEIERKSGKRIRDWTRGTKTKNYLELWQSKNNAQPIIRVQGKGKRQGLWAHPEIVSSFCAWADFEFAGYQQQVIQEQRETIGSYRQIILDTPEAYKKALDLVLPPEEMQRLRTVENNLLLEGEATRFDPDFQRLRMVDFENIKKFSATSHVIEWLHKMEAYGNGTLKEAEAVVRRIAEHPAVIHHKFKADKVRTPKALYIAMELRKDFDDVLSVIQIGEGHPPVIPMPSRVNELLDELDDLCQSRLDSNTGTTKKRLSIA
jgi:hypothetical protein